MGFLVLRSASGDPRLDFALEEALLEAPSCPEQALLLYVAEPCVAIGRNQNPWIEAAPGSGLPLLRRISGGGAVYLDRGVVNWSLIVPRSRHDPGAELALVAAVLESLGIPTASGPRGGLFLKEAGSLEGRKICGTARRMTAGRVLHHGTLLVDARLDRLESALGGMNIQASKALPSVPSPTANLRELRPALEVEGILSRLAGELGGDSPCLDAEEAIGGWVGADRIEAIRERLGSWAWTYGMTPRFTFMTVTPAGPVEVTVRDGLVSEIRGAGASTLSQSSFNKLRGSRFGYDFPAKLTMLY